MVVTRGLDNDVDDEREAWKQSILRAKDVMPEKVINTVIFLKEIIQTHNNYKFYAKIRHPLLTR